MFKEKQIYQEIAKYLPDTSQYRMVSALYPHISLKYFKNILANKTYRSRRSIVEKLLKHGNPYLIKRLKALKYSDRFYNEELSVNENRSKIGFIIVNVIAHLYLYLHSRIWKGDVLGIKKTVILYNFLGMVYKWIFRHLKTGIRHFRTPGYPLVQRLREVWNSSIPKEEVNHIKECIENRDLDGFKKAYDPEKWLQANRQDLLDDAIRKNKIKIANYIYSKGVRIRDFHMDSAATIRNHRMMSWLIKNGGEPWDNTMNTACYVGDIKMARYLKKTFNLRVDWKTVKFSYRTGNRKLVKWALKHMDRSEVNSIVLDNISIYGYFECVKKFRRHFDRFSLKRLVTESIYNGEIDVLKWAIKKGADVTKNNESEAVQYKRKTILRILNSNHGMLTSRTWDIKPFLIAATVIMVFTTYSIMNKTRSLSILTLAIFSISEIWELDVDVMILNYILNLVYSRNICPTLLPSQD